MKKAIVTIALIILLSLPVSAQGIIYFPIILKGADMPDMTIGLVAPRLDYNEILNPSAETTGNFSNVGTGTAARSTTYQKYGLYSYSVTTPAAGDGIQLTTNTLTNAPHFFVARIRFMTPIALRLRLNSTTKNAVLLETIDADWFLYGAFFSAAEASGGTSVQILRTGQPGPGTNGFYADGVHAGPMPDVYGGYSTYVDGTQPGCAWLGTIHGSRSYRSADSLAGGTVIDLFKKYGFFLKRIIGAGVVTPELSIDSYAQLPGGELNNEKTPSRVFTLIGDFYGNTEKDLHAKQQALELALSSSSYPGEQQIRLRFYKSAVQKEIAANYSGGLEGDLPVYYNDLEPGDAQWTQIYRFLMPASIQLTATDPYWYEVGESAVALDTNDTATFRVVAGRLSSTGQWSPLGPPGSGGSASYSTVTEIAEDNTYIYFGGSFTNFDGIADGDRIIRYNKQTGVYTSLGTGANGIVRALTLGPDGKLYAGGDFTTIGGVSANRVAYWDGAAWNAMSTGFDQAPDVLLFSPSGVLYAGGGASVANRVAYWDGAAWNGIAGTGTTGGGVSDMAFTSDGTLYAVGAFTAINGVTVNGIAVWDGSTWSAISDSSNVSVFSIAVSNTNLVYVGGLFSEIGGIEADNIAVWNGTAFAALGTGVNGTVSRIAVGPDHVVYVGGNFTTAGDITLADRVARWNGYAWSHLDIDLPGSPTVGGILPSKYVDPVIKQNYTLWLGFTTTGTGTYAGNVTTTNEGSAPAFPKIIINRSGGTTATLQSIRNERTGLTLLCDYALSAGEEITIDLSPNNRKENSSFFSNVAIVLPNSNMSQWNLLPGNNSISAFVSESGSPTVTGYMLWRDSYKSYN